MYERRVTMQDREQVLAICGDRDWNLRVIEQETGAQISARDAEILVRGEREQVERAVAALETLRHSVRHGEAVTEGAVRFALQGGRFEGEDERIEVWSKQRFVYPKTPGQREYVQAIRKNDVVFGIGPAGTGKTYLAMAMAVEALKRREVSRLILCRPAVEAGEALGFLPGTMYEKVIPYLRPLHDALYEMMDADMVARMSERGIIEIAPLAYMRGRTLNDAFVILDEAQNSTSEQMKMFLTRLGFDSKTVITGDITQIDLPEGRVSGLVEARNILRDIAGIKFVYFTRRDVVRHRIVQEIIRAYEQHGGGEALRRRRKVAEELGYATDETEGA